MPANLTPDYLAAEREYKSAQTAQEKIAALERMLATIPKHKGTEKLQADIKRRLSEERKESQKKGAGHATPFYLVRREGAGQVVLVGPPNSGKSQLVRSLTHALPEVAEFPFTTRLPIPGMMRFEDIQIQLVDLPPLSPDFTEPWLSQVIRSANLSVLVVDVNDSSVLDEIDYIHSQVDDRRIPRPALLVGNKIDITGAKDNFETLADLYGSRYHCLAVSAESGEGLEDLRRAVFEALEIVRVYTKVPGKPAELISPYVLRRGATVEDAALHVHKDFAAHLKYARLFRLGGAKDGLMVDRQRVVADRDILEFHV